MAVSSQAQSPPLDRLAWLLLALVALVAALTFRDYGLGWDDFTHAQYGALLLKLYETHFRDQSALSFVNLYLYGGGFDMAAALLAKAMPFGLFETRRLLGAAVGLIGLFATWRIARRLGGSLAGFVAMLLLAACPLFYGHVFINPKDAPFASAMALFLLGLVRALEQYPRLSWPTVLLLGLGFGLSIGSRILAGFGVIEAVLALGLLLVIDARRNGGSAALGRLGRIALSLIPGAILALAIMALIWPWSVASPLNLVTAIETFSHFFEKPWQELFEGRLIAPPDMPREYVPLLLALKLPEVFSVLAVLGLGGALIASVRPLVPPRRRAALLAVALAAVLPVVVAVALRPAMYNGVRHFLFVLPPLAVLGGLAFAFIAEGGARHGLVAIGAAAAILVAGLALPIIDMVRLHPYEYATFNTASGGVSAAQSRFMLDYWGLALKQGGEALRARIVERGDIRPAERKWRVAVCGPHPPAQVALGDDFEPSWDTKGADLALSLGTFYCARLEAPLLLQIVREGVVFARAYDLRGQEVESLFSLPPVTPRPPPVGAPRP